jgi:pimeloyl-ACP methyl ester carboxylesterase/DNA-binding SARP family transcriptional activator
MLCLLGPSALATDQGLRPLRLRPKALALLARLALANEPQDRGVLASLLFADAARPRDSLRWHLSYIRARVPGTVDSDRTTACFRAPTDVALFRKGVEQILGETWPPDPAGTLALYRGELCAGLKVSASAEFDNWLYTEEDALSRLFRQAALAFARRALAEGRASDALPSLERLAAVDPYLEDGHVLLVQAAEAADDLDLARRAYDRYQRIVRTELHAEPRRELARRYEPAKTAGRGLPLDDLIPLSEITMHVVEWPGADPPILAIHGSGGYAERFTSLGEELAPHVRVIAADLRGHGFSDKPPSGYGIDDHVRDLIELITVLGLQKPILLGHSFGGSIATFVAEAASDRIGGLILYDATVGDQAFTQSSSSIMDFVGPFLERRFASFDDYHAKWETEPDDSKWKRWIVRSGRMALAPLPDGTFRRRSLRQALVEEWASVAQRDSLAALANVTVPVLVVHADGGWPDLPYLDEGTVRSQLAAARDSRLYVAHGLDHFSVVPRPSPGLILALRAFAHEIRQTNDQNRI